MEKGKVAKQLVGSKQKKLSAKISIMLIIMLSIIFFIQALFSISTSKSTLLETINSEFNGIAMQNGIMTQNIFDTAITGTQNLAGYIEDSLSKNTDTSISTNDKEKSQVYDAMLSETSYEIENFILNTLWAIVENNIYIMGAGVFFDPNTFDLSVKDYTLYMTDQDAQNKTASSYGSYEKYGNDAWYSSTIEQSAITVSDPYEEAGLLVTTVAYPIILKGTPHGVVTVDIDTKSFANVKTTDAKYPTMFVDIVNHNDIIVFNSMSDELIGQNFSVYNSPEDVAILKENFAKGNPFMIETNMGEKGKVYATARYYTPIKAGSETWWVQSALTVEDLNKDLASLTFWTIFIACTSLLLILLVSSIIINRMLSPIEEIQRGLENFFSYLNKKTKTVDAIQLHSNDELGQMAKIINENIINIQKGVEEDKKLIDETIVVLQEFQSGDLGQRLSSNSNNPVLTQLKSVLNNMGEHIESNINRALNVIGQYSKYNYLNKVETTGLQEHFLKLANGVNSLGDSITEMLVDNKSKGVELQKSSNILLSNVDKLNQSSIEAAANLEETAAALEEGTANVRHNTQTIQKVSNLASNVTSSIKNGEKLANETTSAMEEINMQISSINEAIAVIDQIAFQTNILSLNAAVEAATAGEAGKGFAVVAAEVRNLATRSAEAAKEIKDLVEQATNKAKQGKSISINMMDGYKQLNDNVLQTIELINNIENSSREQLIGFEHINAAVTSLDIQVQENASIALLTKEVADSTDGMANLIVASVNNKEFIEKEEV